MKKNLVVLFFTIVAGATLNAQCCNVVSSNGVSVVTSNGICAVTSSGLSGDCGGSTKVIFIDTDKDGVEDSKDDCPNTYGNLKGCPDTDSDGIADKDDACPTIAGLSKFNGCADTDGDGVTDKEDACPNIAGLLEFYGCPDTDKDGVPDPLDKCPTIAGLTTLSGCPDTDNDNVADIDDICPEIPGLVENKGCPAVEKNELKLLDQALKGIKFESGKDVILKVSNPILDNVVKVLTDKPMYKLSIEGHTDSQGDDIKNMDLSEKRAAAVLKYLTDKGIDTSRLTSQGFAELNQLVITKL